MNLGNVIVNAGVRIVVGRLTYDEKRHHAMMACDLAALLPLCRDRAEGRLVGYCKPWVEVTEPPYLVADLQLCRTKDKREKMGWVCACDDARGQVSYRVEIDCKAVLKRFGLVWLHLHEHNVKEEQSHG
jgi:hypothetical protein